MRGTHRTLRLNLALVLALTGVIAVASGAAAVKPSVGSAALPDLIVDDTCGFVIEVTFPANQQVARTFVDQDGDVTKLVITGSLKALFTNPATGASLLANISGPTFINVVNGRNAGTGGWALWPDGVLTIMSGHNDFTTGEFRGHVRTNVCEALAA